MQGILKVESVGALTNYRVMWWLFVFSGWLEIACGAVAMISPSSLPSFSKLTAGQGAESVRWWAAAIISLGFGAFMARNAPDTDVGKQALGFAMMLYNVFLSLFCLRVYPQLTSVGVLVHIPLTFGFMYWLKTSTNFFW